MTNQLTFKTLDEELKIRLDRLQINKKVSPWDWAEKIEKADDPVEEFIGNTENFKCLLDFAMRKGDEFVRLLDFAMRNGANFVFENQLENGKLKKFRYTYRDNCVYHVEKKTLKNGQEAMYAKIKSTADDIELEATQTKDGDFVGPFHFKNKEIEVNAFYDEKTCGLEQQALLHGKVYLVCKGDLSLENNFSGSYAHGLPQKIKKVVTVPSHDLDAIFYEKYKDNNVAFAYSKSLSEDYNEYVYKNGQLVKERHMDYEDYKGTQTAKMVGLIALGTVLCMGGIQLVRAQNTPAPIPPQHERG